METSTDIKNALTNFRTDPEGMFVVLSNLVEGSVKFENHDTLLFSLIHKNQLSDHSKNIKWIYEKAVEQHGQSVVDQWDVWKMALLTINSKLQHAPSNFAALWDIAKKTISEKECQLYIVNLITQGGAAAILKLFLDRNEFDLNEPFSVVDFSGYAKVNKNNYLSNGVDYKPEDFLPLALSKDKEILQLLVEYGADLNKKMSNGKQIHEFLKERDTVFFGDSSNRTKVMNWLSSNVEVAWTQELAWKAARVAKQTNDIDKIVMGSKKEWVNWRGQHGEHFGHYVAIVKPAAITKLLKRKECPQDLLTSKDDFGLSFVDYFFASRDYGLEKIQKSWENYSDFKIDFDFKPKGSDQRAALQELRAMIAGSLCDHTIGLSSFCSTSGAWGEYLKQNREGSYSGYGYASKDMDHADKKLRAEFGKALAVLLEDKALHGVFQDALIKVLEASMPNWVKYKSFSEAISSVIETYHENHPSNEHQDKKEHLLWLLNLKLMLKTKKPIGLAWVEEAKKYGRSMADLPRLFNSSADFLQSSFNFKELCTMEERTRLNEKASEILDVKKSKSRAL